MRKPGPVVYGIACLALGVVLLTGCDLLGLGPKKQNSTQNQSAAVPAPSAYPSPQQPAAPGPLPGDALVRIGKWVLTSDDFDTRLGQLKQQLPDFKQEDANTKNVVLDELIRQQLLVQDAEDSGIGDTKEVKDAVADFRKTLLVQEEASRLTKEEVATEEDARSYYDTNKEKFAEPTTWGISEIVVPDEATAKNILVQILQGGDFAQIAQTQSKAASAVDNGKLKPFVTGKAPFAAIQTAISDLSVGDNSGVFKGPEGYYIVKVDSKTGGGVKAFADIKKDLIYGLTMQKQQKIILERLKELVDKYKPEYNKDLIDQVVGKVSQQSSQGS